MLITSKKFRVIIICILVLAIEIVVSINALNNGTEVDSALRFVSAVSAIAFLTELFLWKRLTGELLSPYTVFFVSLFVFCCGQSLGWIFDVKMGIRDLWYRTTYGTNHRILLEGMCYSMIGITSFFFGSVIKTRLDRDQDYSNSYSSDDVIKAYRNIGKLMLILCIPSFLAITLQNVMAVASSGYLAYYSVASSRSVIMRIANILADYFQPCLMILLIGYKDNTSKRRLILAAMMIDVLSSLYVGARSGAFMTVLAVLVAYHYFVSRFTKKQVVGFGIAGYLVMAISNSISLSRVYSGRSIADTFLGLFSATDVINEFIGELGWNISSICWTMNLVPSSEPFRYGMSYLVSLLTFIPSAFFPNGHPVVRWAQLGDWLQSSLGLTSGPGYTMIAEAYINFGWFGFLALFVEGIIVTRCIADVPRERVNDNLFGATFQIIVIMTVMKSLVRASVSAAMRTIIFVIIPLYLILRFSIKKTRAS